MALQSVNPAEIGIEEGDFFSFSWGYDQTNADFYQVVGLTKASVKLRQVCTEVVERDGKRGVVPVKDRFREEKFQVSSRQGILTKRVQVSRGEPFVTMASYGWCSLWDGEPEYDTIALGYAGH